jgi:hypothetical protein
LSRGDHRWFKRGTGEERPVTRENIIIIIINEKGTCMLIDIAIS